MSKFQNCMKQARDLDASGETPTLTELFESNEEELQTLRSWAEHYNLDEDIDK